MSGYFREAAPKTNGFRWLEPHHFYWGMLMIAFGFIGLFEMWTWWVVYGLFAFGLWNIIDDIVQHIMQRVELELKGYYTIRTFLHWVWYPKYW